MVEWISLIGGLRNLRLLIHPTSVIICFIFTSLFLSAGFAEDLKADKKLKTIQHDIAILNQGLKKKQANEVKLQKNLTQTENKIVELTAKIAPVTQQLQSSQQKLSWLAQEHQNHVNALKNEQLRLEKLLTAMYMANDYQKQDTFLRLLLNDDSFADLPRFVSYYHYLQAAKLEQMNDFRHLLTKLEKNQVEVKVQTQTLAKTKQNYEMINENLLKVKQDRQTLLASLRVEIKSDRDHLEQLKKDAQNLERTLAELAKKQSVSKTQYVNPNGRPFNHYRGHMVWPAEGTLLHRFGTAIEKSEMTWKGILIEAKPRQPVRAVADGKVIFADFLRGYGLLMIIDHGQNYLTLYGRNQSLYQKVGQVVKAGDVVGLVGQSGGYDKSGLYFEVRYKGQAIDPERWLST